VPSDLELLDAWRAGDRKAGEVLFDRHFDAIARFFRNKVAEAADDLVQQTFLGCLEARDRFRGHSSFRTFLFAIAHNVLGKHWRGRKGDDAVDLGTHSVHDLAPGLATVLGRAQEQRLLADALRRLPLELQVALELHYWEKLTAAEIGEVIGAPEGTIKTRIRRARELLEAKIAELAASPDLRNSALAGLDEWAAGLREHVLADPAE
jgi:RNA polymerase sigma-70 factor (ECF subfamily)